MSDGPAIIFDNVSKMYHKRAGMGTLLSMIPGLRPRQSDEFWALKDVSFEVKRGECLGIIGPNGAGKSTILKILSRVTSPTSGSYRVNGRLSSLIEVGAGFHPELTGRENVYLNAAILGMSKREIGAKFDDIVDFAELWDFIDVPVKRYSSGMHVRLGFAVAIHTEPEVLLIDEVLAVGDRRFHDKCFKMFRRLRDSRVTLVFVSHDVMMVDRLADEAVCIDRGQVMFRGRPGDVIAAYGVLAESSEKAERAEAATSTTSPVSIEDVLFLDSEGSPTKQVRSREPLTVELRYKVREPVADANINFGFYNGNQLVMASTTLDDQVCLGALDGRGTIRLVFDHFGLPTGRYYLSIGISDREALSFYDWHQKAYPITVAATPPIHGRCWLPHRWEHLRDEE